MSEQVDVATPIPDGYRTPYPDGFRTGGMLRDWYMRTNPDDPVMLHDRWLEQGYKNGYGWSAVKRKAELPDGNVEALIEYSHLAGMPTSRQARRFFRAYAQGQLDQQAGKPPFAEERYTIAQGTPYEATLYVIPDHTDPTAQNVEWSGRIHFTDDALNFQRSMDVLNHEPHLFSTDWIYPRSRPSGAYMYSLLTDWHGAITRLFDRMKASVLGGQYE